MSTPEVLLIALGICGIAIAAFVLLFDRFSSRHAPHRKP